MTVLLDAVSSSSKCVDIPKEDSPVKTYRGNLFLIFGISQDFDIVFVVSQSGHTETFVSTPTLGCHIWAGWNYYTDETIKLGSIKRRINICQTGLQYFPSKRTRQNSPNLYDAVWFPIVIFWSFVWVTIPYSYNTIQTSRVQAVHLWIIQQWIYYWTIITFTFITNDKWNLKFYDINVIVKILPGTTESPHDERLNYQPILFFDLCASRSIY